MNYVLMLTELKNKRNQLLIMIKKILCIESITAYIIFIIIIIKLKRKGKVLKYKSKKHFLIRFSFLFHLIN
jgi:hypothetical protein